MGLDTEAYVRLVGWLACGFVTILGLVLLETIIFWNDCRAQSDPQFLDLWFTLPETNIAAMG